MLQRLGMVEVRQIGREGSILIRPSCTAMTLRCPVTNGTEGTFTDPPMALDLWDQCK